MLTACLPPRETERLNALKSHHILDTEADSSFDRLTRLASIALQAPIALLGFLDHDRHWFKSNHGFLHDGSPAEQIPRSTSFCSHALHSSDPVIVEDALQDKRFAENPLVTGPPNVRSYFAIPICVEEDLILGTLCVMDTEPRVFLLEQLEALKLLATIAEQELGKWKLLQSARSSHPEAPTHVVVDDFLTLSAREAQLRLMFEESGGAIVSTNSEGLITEWNCNAAWIFGTTPEEAQGQSVSLYVPEQYLSERHNTIAHLNHGSELHPIETKRRGQDGSMLDVSVVYSVQYDAAGSQVGVTEFLRDISETETRSRMEAQFISMVSHELKTPVTCIRGALGLVVEGITGSLPPRARELIDIAFSNSEQLVRLLNSAIDQAPFGRSIDHFELAPVDALLNACIDEHESAAQKRGVFLERAFHAPNEAIRVDPDRFAQAIGNLISNALQHSLPGTRITLSTVTESEHIRFAVRDRGPEVTKRTGAEVLEPAGTRSLEVLGMGLMRAKQIVKSMGGTFGFRPARPKGAIFEFRLPLAAVGPLDREVE
ncbi:MAG: PAS domain S-box protein [Myxococcota bacterium]